MKNHLFEDKFYEIDKINNFINFLKSDFKIKPNKTLKEIIIEALTFNQEKSTLFEDINLLPSNQFSRTRSNFRKIDPLFKNDV